MANKIPSRGEFSIPSALIDVHEWISDSLIDNGQNCKLIYPQKTSECPNCYLDIDTGKSTAIYKTGGPIQFTNYTICPYCQGEGHLYAAQEETIKCRVYYNSKYFLSNDEFRQDANIKIDNDTIQIITYLSNLSKIERAEFIIIDSDIATAKQYRCTKASPAIPHGFRHNRYLVQLWRRVG